MLCLLGKLLLSLMLKKLDYYIIRELLPPLFMGMFAFIMIFHAGVMYTGYKDFADHPNVAKAIFSYLLYKTPYYLNFVFPISMAFGSALSFSRLARELEIVAIKGAGIRIMRAMIPVIAVGFIMAIANFLVAEYLMIHTEKKAREIKNEAKFGIGTTDYKQNVTIFLDKKYTASFRDTYRKKDDSVLFKDAVLLHRLSHNKLRLVHAEKGSYVEGVWRFYNVTDRLILDGKQLYYKDLKSFGINQEVQVSNLFAPPIADEQSFTELRKAIKEGKEHKIDVNDLEIAYNVKFTIPLACVIFAITGPIFAIIFARFGGFMGLLVSIFLVMCYFNAHVFCTSIVGKNNWLPPVISAWLPNTLFAIVGIAGVRKIE